MDKAIQLVMVAAVAVLVAAAIASMFMGQSDGFTGFLDEQRESASGILDAGEDSSCGNNEIYCESDDNCYSEDAYEAACGTGSGV